MVCGVVVCAMRYVLCRHVFTQLLPSFLSFSPSSILTFLSFFNEGRALIAILVCVCAVVTYNVFGPNRYDCCNQVKEGGWRDGETGEKRRGREVERGRGGEREKQRDRDRDYDHLIVL